MGHNIDLKLAEFLNDVWAARRAIDQSGRPESYIYNKLYSKTPSGSATKMQVDPERFLDGLRTLQAKRRGGKLSGQTTGDAIFGGGGESVTPQDLHHDFYHFNPADWQHGASVSKIKWRVYLNPKADDALAVMGELVERYVDDKGIDRPVKAKVVGPGSLGRRDTIVVYTHTDKAAKTIARRYSATPERFSGQETPALTGSVIPGVAVAAEPPGISVFNDRSRPGSQSFGMYRCEIIATALQEAKARGWRKSQFKEMAAEYLFIAGVNPGKPHGQVKKTELERVVSAGQQARLQRR